MDKTYKVALVLLNILLSKFNLKISKGVEIKFLYKIQNYTNVEESRHLATKIISVSDNIDDIFPFLKIEKNKVLGAKTIFELVAYLVDECPYFTLSTAKYIENVVKNDVQLYTTDRDVYAGLKEVVTYIQSNQKDLPTFSYMPHLVYANLREAIVRQNFPSEELDNTIIKYKKEYLPEEIEDKFTSKKAVTWVPELKKDSKLAGNVVAAFVNHVTNKDTETFPDYLVDTPRQLIRREFITFFNFVYMISDEYRIRLLEGANSEDVVY